MFTNINRNWETQLSRKVTMKYKLKGAKIIHEKNILDLFLMPTHFSVHINSKYKSKVGGYWKEWHMNHALLMPNLSALFSSFSSFSVWLIPTDWRMSSFFIFFFSGPVTTPNRSCRFFSFSSNSAFFMTVADDCPNRSARFFRVSKSTEGAAPILVDPPVPNLSARACFLVSEATSTEAPKRAARAAARSASVFPFFAGETTLLASESVVDSVGSLVSNLQQWQVLKAMQIKDLNEKLTL